MRRASQRSPPETSRLPTMSTPSSRPVAPTCACWNCRLPASFDRGAAEFVEACAERTLLKPELCDELARPFEAAPFEKAARLLIGHLHFGVASGRFGEIHRRARQPRLRFGDCRSHQGIAAGGAGSFDKGVDLVGGEEAGGPGGERGPMGERRPR